MKTSREIQDDTSARISVLQLVLNNLIRHLGLTDKIIEDLDTIFKILPNQKENHDESVHYFLDQMSEHVTRMKDILTDKEE